MPKELSTWTEGAHLLFLAVLMQSTFIPVTRYLSLLPGDTHRQFTFVLLYEAVLFMMTFVTRMDCRRSEEAEHVSAH
jgi:hypothetical protein